MPALDKLDKYKARPDQSEAFVSSILGVLISDCQTQLQWHQGTFSAHKQPYGPCSPTQWLSCGKPLDGQKTHFHIVDTIRCLLSLKFKQSYILSAALNHDKVPVCEKRIAGVIKVLVVKHIVCRHTRS